MREMDIRLPGKIVRTVEQVANEYSISKVEVIRRTFAILQIAQEERVKGNSIGIIHGDEVVARLVGNHGHHDVAKRK